MTATSLAVTLVGLCYGLVAFAITLTADDGTGGLTARARQMLATIVAAAVGAFAESRGLGLEQLVISGLAVGAFASAFCARSRTFGSTTSWTIVIALGIVLFASLLEGQWLVIVAATSAALPFGLTALLVRERGGPLYDALLAALAGALLGFAGAYIVLFIACLTTLAIGKARRIATSEIAFAPAIAAFGAVEILLTVSLQA